MDCEGEVKSEDVTQASVFRKHRRGSLEGQSLFWCVHDASLIWVVGGATGGLRRWGCGVLWLVVASSDGLWDDTFRL